MKDAAPIFVVGSFVAALSMKVPRLPVPGESLRGDALILEAGGKGLNVAIALRRLGMTVDGVLAVGSDHFAAMAEEALAEADLPSDMLCRFPGPSGTGVGLIGEGGENMIAVYPGANALLSAREIDHADARITASGAVVAQFETGDAPIAAAFAAARRHGARTILNPSPYRPIALDILQATDILVVNVTEAAALLEDLTGATAIRGPDHLSSTLAEALIPSGVDMLVVTLGAEGAALWHRKEGWIRQPAFPIEAIDATGCGDAFLAGLVAALARAESTADALRHATACGAITCTRIGVVDALPDADRIKAMIAA